MYTVTVYAQVGPPFVSIPLEKDQMMDLIGRIDMCHCHAIASPGAPRPEAVLQFMTKEGQVTIAPHALCAVAYTVFNHNPAAMSALGDK